MNPVHACLRNILVFMCFFVMQFACRSNGTGSRKSVLLVAAHPDDETLVSGTLAKLADQGCSVTVVFVTSGDDGEDVSGRGLSGESLAAEREIEAGISLEALGVRNPPIFLELPDSRVDEHWYALKDALLKVFGKVKPVVVISFGPDGVTDDYDHKMTGFAADHVFDMTDCGQLMLHLAVSEKASNVLPFRAPVSDAAINLRVDVSSYSDARIKSHDAHRTQFSPYTRDWWKRIVQDSRFEEYIIARNRGKEAVVQAFFPEKRPPQRINP